MDLYEVMNPSRQPAMRIAASEPTEEGPELSQSDIALIRADLSHAVPNTLLAA